MTAAPLFIAFLMALMLAFLLRGIVHGRSPRNDRPVEPGRAEQLDEFLRRVRAAIVPGARPSEKP
jgi:hypothetical protein